MSEKKILVKEVCHKTSVLSQFDGLIKTPIPIHEVYQIKHKISTPRVLVGKKIIALLGNILIKVYCVKKESFEVFLIEKCFNYRNYIPGDYFFHHLKHCTSLKHELKDIIIESINEDGIRLAGIIRTHLTLTLEKEYDLKFVINHVNYEEEQTAEVEEPINLSYHEQGVEIPKDDNIIFEESSAIDVVHPHSSEENEEEEIYAEVIQGQNQDLTIILE